MDGNDLKNVTSATGKAIAAGHLLLTTWRSNILFSPSRSVVTMEPDCRIRNIDDTGLPNRSGPATATTYSPAGNPLKLNLPLISGRTVSIRLDLGVQYL